MPPKGLAEPFETFLNCTFHKTKKSSKKFHIARGFNLNALDHHNCKKGTEFPKFIVPKQYDSNNK